MRLRLAQSAALAVVVAGCGGGAEPASRSRSAAPEWRALAPASLARTEVAAARVGRFVYVMGGFERESGATTAATERYDIERDRWTRVADMPVALNHAAAASYKGRVYVLGGYRARTGLSREVATLYRFNPRRDRWTRLPSAPTSRGALAVGVIGRRLYAVGGANTDDGSARDAGDLRLPQAELAHGTGHGGPARAPRRSRRRPSLLRARRPGGRPGQLHRRRGLRPAHAPLASRARDAQGARGDRRGHDRRPHRRRRRRGVGRHDPGGRAVRRAPAATGAACQTCRRRATAWAPWRETAVST